MTERWLPVVGCEQDYEVSDLGRVRSVDRIKVYERRDQYSGKTLTVTRHHKGRVLRPGPKESGHLSVMLGRNIGSRDVHRLVLDAFVGSCPTGQESLHDNDTPSDNRLANLSWGTRSQNLLDAVRNGKKPVGEKHGGAKLKSSNIPDIREQLPYRSLTDIAADYGVSWATIRSIRDGKTWKHVS